MNSKNPPIPQWCLDAAKEAAKVVRVVEAQIDNEQDSPWPLAPSQLVDRRLQAELDAAAIIARHAPRSDAAPCDRGTAPTLESLADIAWERSQRQFLACGAVWKDSVATALNVILGRVQYEMETCLPPDEHDIQFAQAALSMVERLAYLEGIERERAPAPTQTVLGLAIGVTAKTP